MQEYEVTDQDGQVGNRVYEVRFGFTVQDVSTISVCAGFALVAFLPGCPLLLRIACLGFFGGGGLVYLYQILNLTWSRRVALRVDATGITLGESPILGHRKGIVRVPWCQLTSVAVVTEPGRHPLTYICVATRDRPSALPNPPASWRDGVHDFGIPHPSPGLFTASRRIIGWELNRTRLEQAVKQNAPGVDVLYFS
ncbi:hypothetical protein FOH10_25660 [Nocardia otitidiscaviarum]|uniref:Uncharacterized protein n=1 Tax=Nocardia otitidiscaviarum TaxID=1823 RepID=A0A516NRX3_9NOCA|nr:hypothetical protein [Nocardia otitidiscaviarum]MCP9620811.1 hypothetical protein [Nocardia otitidiscaviarum]QDP81604.1 hypothetical protein FOH10_25660 [Nocardia otitidiscaviarum]